MPPSLSNIRIGAALASLREIPGAVREWLGPVPGSLLNHVNGAELYRAVQVAAAAGVTSGGSLAAFCRYGAAHLPEIVPDPLDRQFLALGVGAATALIAFGREFKRRYDHHDASRFGPLHDSF